MTQCSADFDNRRFGSCDHCDTCLKLALMGWVSIKIRIKLVAENVNTLDQIYKNAPTFICDAMTPKTCHESDRLFGTGTNTLIAEV